MKQKRERIFWFRPDYDGAAMHGFRKTGEQEHKKGKRIYTSLCGAVVLHRDERLPNNITHVFDEGVCAICQRKRLDG